MTQAQRLYAVLRRRRMTTMQMLQTGISVCPWKRLAEGRHHLRPGEYLDSAFNKDGLRVYWVAKAQA